MMPDYSLLANPALLTQDNWDSGALIGLTAVTHKVTRVGTVSATFLLDDAPHFQTPLHIVAAVPQPNPAGPAGNPPALPLHVGNAAGSAPLLPAIMGPTVLDASLATAGTSPTALSAPAEGYIQVVGSVPTGGTTPAQAATLVATPGSGLDSEAWDSRNLSADDVFTAVLLRPGAYTITNQISGHETTVTVDYPQPAASPQTLSDPLALDDGPDGFAPADAHLLPFQGMNVSSSSPARYVVKLTAPQDVNPVAPAVPAAVAVAPATLPKHTQWQDLIT